MLSRVHQSNTQLEIFLLLEVVQFLIQDFSVHTDFERPTIADSCSKSSNLRVFPFHAETANEFFVVLQAVTKVQ